MRQFFNLVIHKGYVGCVNGYSNDSFGPDDTLTPAGNATRCQFAAILMRFCENVAK